MHPANEGLARLFGNGSSLPVIVHPDAVTRPYETLGTHPDLVARLWDELGGEVPAQCRMVFCGMPVLMHPLTGIVFAFARGTHAYALRLPGPERMAALAAGATRIHRYGARQAPLDLQALGEEWVFGSWQKNEQAWCRAAHAAAGSTPG